MEKFLPTNREKIHILILPPTSLQNQLLQVIDDYHEKVSIISLEKPI